MGHLAELGRLRHGEERSELVHGGTELLDGCGQLRGHIRDVIKQCLSETQKMHIGISVGEDFLAAGELKSGGVMAGYVCQEVDVPCHHGSRAAYLRQLDEMHRDRRLHPQPCEVAVSPPLTPQRSASLPRLVDSRACVSPCKAAVRPPRLPTSEMSAGWKDMPGRHNSSQKK